MFILRVGMWRNRQDTGTSATVQNETRKDRWFLTGPMSRRSASAPAVCPGQGADPPVSCTWCPADTLAGCTLVARSAAVDSAVVSDAKAQATVCFPLRHTFPLRFNTRRALRSGCVYLSSLSCRKAAHEALPAAVPKSHARGTLPAAVPKSRARCTRQLCRKRAGTTRACVSCSAK